ncbi:type III pantothenate kinase [Aliiglaciecola sp. CAU 1673]|uniref:type III pantothenate kinase n=1 Tax=Aliiglaciecola sp. CAU 1673 TaxID=3032595 RepID=UPI0023DC9569|nr:type III pantothenate kinase [Aliiglaciecola sp. CAU 1673]MDF2178575.1 type III pantothenate kinase [Aliiglaciecola sp. CAU 1673]
MSDKAKALLVDVGNSRIKFCFLNDGKLSNIECLNHEAELVSKLRGVSQVLVSAVGQASRVKVLADIATQQGVSFNQLSAQKSAFGLVNVYENYATMGVDRWLAMLGARTLTKQAFAVLDFGTAITCDFVDESGAHLGGWIAPGINMMRSSLLTNTEKVFGRNEGWMTQELGRSTADCVDSGCIAMARGIVKQAQDTLSRLTSGQKMFACGGDCKLLFENDAANLEINAGLIFLGMALIAGDCAQQRA